MFPVLSFIMIMKPTKGLGSVWTAYTSEFSSGVWLCVIALIVTGSALFYFICRVNPLETVTVTFGESFMVTVGIIAAQGNVIKNNHIRTV